MLFYSATLCRARHGYSSCFAYFYALRGIVKIAQIAAIAAYLPKERLDNAELVKAFPKWTEKKLEAKLGIVERPISAEGETAVDLACAACRRLFDAGLANPDEIDFVLLCTQSPDYLLPSSACLLQARLGLPKTCGAFDINLGCSGYVYGLSVCKGLIESGVAKKVLFVTAETYCKYVNELDSVSRPIFGDGAAATLVEVAQAEQNDALGNDPGVGPFEFGTDGEGANMLIIKAGGSRTPTTSETMEVKMDVRGNYRSQNQLYMNGPGVFSFSINVVPPMIERFQKLAREKNADIDAYILHQANNFRLDRLRGLCSLDEEKFFNNMATRANTVSSTIPIALIDAVASGLVKPGSRLLLVGFGVGLSWGACLARLPETFKVVPLEK